MDRIDRWKLADELNAHEISLLIAGYDPAEFTDYPTQWPKETQRDTAPFMSAIKNAAKSKKFSFNEKRNYNGDDIDWTESTIEIESFVDWLKGRNFADGFFVQANDSKSDIISDPDGEFYAAKLAAAVRAWTEVTADPAALNGKTPKRALEIWLRKHANEYGLTGKDGRPNELGIEEVCKVANWKPAGGATPTPTYSSPPTPAPRPGRIVKARPPTGRVRQPVKATDTIDDDIPF